MTHDQFTIQNILFTIIGAIIGSGITLWLTNWKENQEGEIRFENCLFCLAHELKFNFKYVGNFQNPFLTKALEKLVYEERFVHYHPELFKKAQKCLNTALILSTSSHSKHGPADGQFLMKDLCEYLEKYHGIHIDS